MDTQQTRHETEIFPDINVRMQQKTLRWMLLLSEILQVYYELQCLLL